MRKAATLPGIAGNDLNRCDAPALQHKIRANIKRTAAFFADSRLRVVGMGSGGWKRGVLDRNMERFVRIKGFLHVKRRLLRTVKSRSNERCFGCENERFLRAVCKLSVNGKILVCEKGRFSAHAKQPDKEKTFFQRTTTPISHCNKTNVQLQISSATTYCELAVHLFFFGKQRSCVCTTVTLSHRFKAFSLPFCRQNRFRHEPSGIFAKSLPAEL